MAIISSAKSLFLDIGIEHTSISLISKEAGVAKSLFYYYFETKEELVLAIIEELCDEHLHNLERKIESEAHDSLDSLLILVNSFLVFTHKESAFQGEHDFNIRCHNVYLIKIQTLVTKIISMAQEEGYVVIKYPMETFMMMLEGLLRLQQEGLSQDKVVSMIEQTLHLPQSSLVDKALYYLHNFEKEVD